MKGGTWKSAPAEGTACAKVLRQEQSWLLKAGEATTQVEAEQDEAQLGRRSAAEREGHRPLSKRSGSQERA